MQLIGSGVLDFPLPLRGRQEIEVAFQIKGAAVAFRVMICADPDYGMILVDPSGTVLILDRKSGIGDEVGEPGQLYLNHTHRLRIVHDGEKHLEVFLDDKRTAELKNVGARVRGTCGFAVHSSNAVMVKEISIAGVPDPLDPTCLREQFVTTVLASLWP
jgi:hypothetical protein